MMNINQDYPTSSRTLILMVVMIYVIKVVWIKGLRGVSYGGKGGSCGGNGGRGGSMDVRGGGGGEVKEGGDDFRVVKSLLGDMPGDVIRVSGGETFGVEGGFVWHSVGGDSG
nr:hypothetical protein [Tanacetum cinerariifolium]